MDYCSVNVIICLPFEEPGIDRDPPKMKAHGFCLLTVKADAPKTLILSSIPTNLSG